MPSDDRPRTLVRLLTWLSPAFPTGAYAYSHALEWAVEARDVRDEHGLLRWLDDVLRFGAGRTDAILLRHAHRADTPEALAVRLRTYHEETNPILELLHRKEYVISVDATPEMEVVQAEIMAKLGLSTLRLDSGIDGVRQSEGTGRA